MFALTAKCGEVVVQLLITSNTPTMIIFNVRNQSKVWPDTGVSAVTFINFSDEDIAAFEAARAEAAKVQKNPLFDVLFNIKNYLEEATEKLADGNLDHAKNLIGKATDGINDYCTQLIAKTENAIGGANEVLTEEDAYNIRAMVDSSKDVYRLMAETIMQKNDAFDLIIRRILSLEKLYLFEQKRRRNLLR